MNHETNHEKDLSQLHLVRKFVSRLRMRVKICERTLNRAENRIEKAQLFFCFENCMRVWSLSLNISHRSHTCTKKIEFVKFCFQNWFFLLNYFCCIRLFIKLKKCFIENFLRLKIIVKFTNLLAWFSVRLVRKFERHI